MDLSQLSWGVQSSCVDKYSSNSVFCSEKTVMRLDWCQLRNLKFVRMRFPWIASKYVSLMNNLQSSWGVWDIATQKQGGRLFDQWFKAGLVTEMAQTFILVGWLPIKSQLDTKLRLETDFVIYTKQTLRQIVFAFKFLKITNPKVLLKVLETINHCQTD